MGGRCPHPIAIVSIKHNRIKHLNQNAKHFPQLLTPNSSLLTKKKSRRVYTQQLRISVADSVKQAVERLMRHVDIRLGDDLERRVHAQHDIDLAQLADLPLDVVLREHGADLAHELS